MNLLSPAILDIPVYKSRIQSLHTLFSLYSEFKGSQVWSLWWTMRQEWGWVALWLQRGKESSLLKETFLSAHKGARGPPCQKPV